mgnify:FL=1|jgi:light-harvesting complex 1 beta chain
MADKGFFSESGLTEGEAKEVNGYVTQFFFIFLAFAIVAHFLVWFWRPWIDTSARGAIETAQAVLTMVV